MQAQRCNCHQAVGQQKVLVKVTEKEPFTVLSAELPQQAEVYFPCTWHVAGPGLLLGIGIIFCIYSFWLAAANVRLV